MKGNIPNTMVLILLLVLLMCQHADDKDDYGEHCECKDVYDETAHDLVLDKI